MRGEAPDLIIIDEAAFMPAKQFSDNVLPILGNNNRALIAISTPADDSNWYSQVLNILIERDSPFRIIAKQLACMPCRIMQREAQCTHNKHLLPSYKNPKVTRLQQLILPEEVYMAEVQGIICTSGYQVFHKKHIQQLEQRARYTFGHCDVVWVAVDPSGGSSTQSQMSIVAFAINRSSHFVVRGR